MKTSKLRTFVGQSAYFEPVLTFCYLDAIFKNRALAPDVLKIFVDCLSILSFSKRSKLCSRAERLHNFDDVVTKQKGALLWPHFCGNNKKL